MGSPIRVLLVNMPRLLSEMVRELLADAKIDVAGELTAPADIMRAASGAGVDAVIVSAAGMPAPPYRERDDCSRLKLLTLVDDGASAVLYRLRPTSECLGEISSATLVEAIRGTP